MTADRRNSSKPMGIGKIILFAAIVIIATVGWQMLQARAADTPAQTGIDKDLDLLQVMIPGDIPAVQKQYTGMLVSFNPSLHIPNWVAWELTGVESTGDTPRNNKFYCDETVAGCPDFYEYNYSGYDRGHMAPAGDMKWSRDAMHDTFYLTNICPQVKSLNTGAWKRLEEKCRKWARTDSAIVIVCGPVITDKPIEYIGDSRIAVPRRFFKAVISPYANPPRGIAFVMPNGKVPGGMQAAATTIDEVERITGYDLFSALPDDIENEIESQCDFPYWSTLK